MDKQQTEILQSISIYRTTFKDKYMAYSNILDTNVALKFNNWEDYSSGTLFHALLDKIDFNHFHLIEYDRASTNLRRLYLDVDISVPVNAIQPLYNYIREILVPTDKLYKYERPCYILRNNKSGKLHIIFNATSNGREYSYKPDGLPKWAFKRYFIQGITKHIGMLLYDNVIKQHTDISKVDWVKAVDVQNINTLRAAYSVKYKDNKLTDDYYEPFDCKDEYIPKDEFELKERSLMTQLEKQYGRKSREYRDRLRELKKSVLDKFSDDDTANGAITCSIYRPAHMEFTDCADLFIAGTKHVDEYVEKERKKSKYDDVFAFNETDMTGMVNGKREHITKTAIERKILSLHDKYLTGKSWSYVLQLLKSIHHIIDFDNKKFLDDYSSRHTTEYNKEGNINQWNRFSGDIPIGSALGRFYSLKFKMTLNMWTSPSLSKHEFIDFHKCRTVQDLYSVLNESLSVVCSGGVTRIWTRSLDANDSIIFTELKPTQLNDIDKKFEDTIVDKNGDEKQIYRSLREVVGHHSTYSTYKGIEFFPDLIGPKTIRDNSIFNIFTGWKYTIASELPLESVERINPILNHIKNIWCRNNEANYDYIIKYIAHMYQRPAEKPDVAIILKSQSQGAGKNILLDFIGNLTMGRQLYLYYSSVRELTETKFNSEMASKLLVVVDETANSDSTKYETTEKLKAIITRTRLLVEKKGKDKYEINDFARYWFCSNAACPLHIDLTDRRYFILDVSDDKCRDKLYFTNLFANMNNDTAEIFFNYMMKVDLTNFNPREYPTTEAKEDMKIESLPLTLKFLVDIVSESNEEILSESAQCFYDMFVRFCTNNGLRTLSNIIFGREINEYVPIKFKKEDRKTIRYREIKMNDLRDKLRQKIGNIDVGEYYTI